MNWILFFARYSDGPEKLMEVVTLPTLLADAKEIVLVVYDESTFHANDDTGY